MIAYNFTTAQIGYIHNIVFEYSFPYVERRLTYMSPFIFTGIAALLCGPLTDYVTRKMAKMNNGIFEPGKRKEHV
jgi:hypothetical protein